MKFRQPEVGQLGVAALRDQDVLGLDVAVQDAGVVRRGEPIGDTGQQLDGLAPAALRSSRPIPERAAVDELGDQILPALELARVVHRDDVRVIERRGGLGFALEAAARGRVGELVGKKLDRDRPIEFGIERPIDHTHAAGAERRLHLVHAEPKAGQDRRRRLAQHLRCDVSGGPVQKILRARRATQKRLHFEPEAIIAAAFGLQERVTLARWSFERRVVEPLDLAPAFGVHWIVLGGDYCHGATPSFTRDRDPASSCFKSQLRAMRQSRATVSRETSSTAAVSSTLRPAKNRSSTTRTLRGSIAPSASSASSSAIRSRGACSGSGAAIFTSSVTCCGRPPRFADGFRARQVDEHTPHRAGGDGEKVVSIVPIDLPRVVQPEERFVDEGRRLKRVAGALAAHVLRRAGSELVVQHGRHARVRGFVACVPCPQELGHLASW